VEENSGVVITNSSLNVLDQDTPENELLLTIIKKPSYGQCLSFFLIFSLHSLGCHSFMAVLQQTSIICHITAPVWLIDVLVIVPLTREPMERPRPTGLYWLKDKSGILHLKPYFKIVSDEIEWLR